MPLEERPCLFPAAVLESVPHRLPTAPPSLPKVCPEDVLRHQTETQALGLISMIKQHPCHGNTTQFLKEVYFKDKSQELPPLPPRLGSARRGPAARQMAAPPGAAGAAGAAGTGRGGAGRRGGAWARTRPHSRSRSRFWSQSRSLVVSCPGGAGWVCPQR